MQTDKSPVIRTCVWCGERNDTPLLLCPLCEARAQSMKEARGEPIR